MTRFGSLAQAGFVARYAGGPAHARPNRTVAPSFLTGGSALSTNGVIPLFEDTVLTTPRFKNWAFL
jgi:hypothetical protein